MKLIFKQRFFSWLDSYDIYDEKGETLFTVEGQLSLGHTLHVHNRHGEHVATLTEELFSLLPSFHVYHQEEHVGSICKEFSFFMPSFTIDYKGWSVQGDFFACDYQVFDEAGNEVSVADDDASDGEITELIY